MVGMCLNRVKHACRMVRVDKSITTIDNRQRLERIKTKGKMLQLGKLYRPGTDGARAKPAPRPVGDSIVIGNAADDDIGTV